MKTPIYVQAETTDKSLAISIGWLRGSVSDQDGLFVSVGIETEDDIDFILCPADDTSAPIEIIREALAREDSISVFIQEPQG